MKLEEIKEVTKMNDFKNVKERDKFILEGDVVVYVGKKSTNPVVIATFSKNSEEVFKEMEIYELNYKKVQVIDKKHPLYNLYNQIWEGVLN
jgi:hypothetical protein